MPPDETRQSLPDHSTVAVAEFDAIFGAAKTAEEWVEAAGWWIDEMGEALPEASPMFKALVDVVRECQRRSDRLDTLRAENERYRTAIKTALDTMAVANDEQMGPGGVARKAYAHLWHEYFAIPAGIKRSVASDEVRDGE